MSYFEGTVAAGDATPAATIRTAIKAVFTGVNCPANWSFVEDYDNSTGIWTVLKCEAAGTAGADFYVVIGHVSAGTGSVRVLVGEAYNTSTHVLTKAAITGGSSSTSATYTTGSDCASTNSGLTASTMSTTATYPHPAPAMSTTSASNWCMVTWGDGLLVSVKATTQSAVYVGNFTSLVYNAATNDQITIACIPFGGARNTTQGSYWTNCGATRSAMNASLSTTHMLLYSLWHDLDYTTGILGKVLVTDSTTWDKYSGATPGAYFQPLLIMRAAGSFKTTNADLNLAASGSTGGLVRGKLDRVVGAGGGAWGDTLTVGSDTYQCVATVSSQASMWVKTS